jgi:hypothetical protein
MTDPAAEITPEDTVEPAGSEADLIEQATDHEGEPEPETVRTTDPEVPLEDAWEQGQPVDGDDEDDRRS